MLMNLMLGLVTTVSSGLNINTVVPRYWVVHGQGVQSACITDRLASRNLITTE